MTDSYYENSSFPSMKSAISWSGIRLLWNNKRSSILDKPWYDDLCMVLRERQSLDEFIKEKNAKIYHDYMEDHASSALRDKPQREEELLKAQEKQTQTSTVF